MTKRCSHCREVLPLSSFWKAGKCGLHNRCKKCHQAGCIKWRKNNREYVAAAMRRIYRTEAGRRRAIVRGRVQNALKSGKLVRRPCEVCGDVRVQAHHDDYTKPLDVRWLCPKHHHEVHGQVLVRNETALAGIAKLA